MDETNELPVMNKTIQSSNCPIPVPLSPANPGAATSKSIHSRGQYLKIPYSVKCNILWLLLGFGMETLIRCDVLKKTGIRLGTCIPSWKMIVNVLFIPSAFLSSKQPTLYICL